jgi:hypothetical protein
MDHVPAHNAVGGQHARARGGARRRYVPPDAPALWPLEPWWSQGEPAWRKAEARPRAPREAASPEAMLMVPHTEARGWCKHGGYP